MHAATMADLTTGDGSRIQNDRLACIRSTSTSKWIWPVEHPSTSDKTVWRNGLQLMTSNNGALPAFQRLGKWTTRPHMEPEYFLQPSTRRLFRWFAGNWWIYEPGGDGPLRCGSNLAHVGVSATLPDDPDLEPATAFVDYRGAARFTGSASLHAAETDRPVAVTMRAHIDLQANYWPLRLSNFPNHGANIAKAIQQGTAIGASNGSYMPHAHEGLGSAAWVLEDPDSGDLCQ